jgi:tetratricopeptide (TPR) repeat protein
LIENFVSFPTAVVRRACIENCGIFDLTYGMGIDYDLWLRISARYEFDFVPDATVRYRIWAGQMSKNYRKRYESAIRIMQHFVEQHPDVVDVATIRKAWAHTYLGRGDSILWQEKDSRAARRDYFRALKYRPDYWPAWRAVLRSFIKMDAPRARS